MVLTRPRRLVQSLLQHPAAKLLLFVAALLPLTLLVLGVVHRTLGPNPAETLIRSLGDWTLRFLCLTLAVTPLRQWTGLAALARLRRMLGLFTAFYAALHFCAYAVFDMGLVWPDIVRDVAKRPFILVGSAAFLLLLPLAATSFDRAVRGLGAARWQALHRIVYAIAPLALLHFFWMRAGKRNFGEVAVYAAILGVLLGWRLYRKVAATRYFMKLGSHSARGWNSSTTASPMHSATTKTQTPRKI